MSERVPAPGRPVRTSIEHKGEGFALTRRVTMETQTVEVEKLYVGWIGEAEGAQRYNVSIDLAIYHHDTPSIVEAMRIRGAVVAEKTEKIDHPNGGFPFDRAA